MAADSSDHDLPADDGAARREPPTIDLDPSDVSGDTVRDAKVSRSALGHRWRRLRARVRPSLVQQKGIIIGTVCAALLILVASWSSDWINTVGGSPDSQRVDQSAAVNDLSARLSQLEAQVKTAPAPDASTSRLAAIEKQVGTLSGSVSDLQRKVESTTASLDELKSAPRNGSSVDLGPITARLLRLEQAAGAAQSVAPETNLPLRRALVAQALDAAVRGGGPFVDRLALAKQLNSDASLLAPLEPFASSGVPNDATLGRNLLALLPQSAPQTAALPAAVSDGSVMDRLIAGASRLVHVQRVEGSSDQVAGSGAAGSDRVVAAIRSGNIAQARREIDGLPDSARAATKPWLDSVARRDAALDASNRFVTSSLSALADDPASGSSSQAAPAQ
jgi:hypothetical protein